MPARFWTPVEGGGDCYTRDIKAGRTFSDLDPYLNAAVYPTFRLRDGIYLFGGAAIDTLTTGYEESVVLATGEVGTPVADEGEEHFETQVVGIALAGIDARIWDNLGFLMNVQVPLGALDLPAPVIEWAVSLAF